MRAREWIASLREDAIFAIRQIRRAPGFAAAVAVTLALGIGANAAMFGVADRLLLRPPTGVTHPERVARLYFTRTYSWAGKTTTAASSYGDYLALRSRLHGIEGIAIYGTFAASMGRGAGAMQVSRTLATPSYFTLLGVRPALGRFFVESEERVPLGDAVAVLSYGFWQRQFGGVRDVLGRAIQLGAREYRIVGVAARDFSGTDVDPTDVWVPFSAAGSELGGEGWYRPGMWTGPNILVRVKAGYDIRTIEARATTLFRHTLEESENSQVTGTPRSSGGIAATPFSDSTARVELGSIIAGRAPPAARENGPRIALWLVAMAAVVLLIACGNVTNLLLSRAAARQSEIGVRMALGASRARIARQLLVDTVVLVVLGGVLGLGVGIAGAQLIHSLLLPNTAPDARFDSRILVFTLLVTFAAAWMAALAPSLAASRLRLADSLRANARSIARRSRTREAMVLVQAALSVVLLVGATLFVRSLRNVLAIDLGFDSRRLAIATVDFSNSSFTRGDIDAFYRAAAMRLRELPGVESTALTSSIPFWSSSAARLSVPGRAHLPITKDGGPYLVQVTPSYFVTAGTRVVRGRSFTVGDVPGSARVAIVSETMARLVWPAEDALGKCIRIGGDSMPCTTVVGVARDARRFSLEALPVMQYYVPLDQHQWHDADLAVLVRTSSDPGTHGQEVRRAMTAIEANLPYVDVRPLQGLVDRQMQPWRIGAGIFVAFGIVAMLIASVGMYGVIAYEVGQRAHEFGVRIALGATSPTIFAHVLRRGFVLAVVGVGAGAFIARLGAPWLAPLLFETPATSPAVFAFVCGVILAVALLACFVPARRAALSDPATALRAE